ncbi:MAG: aminotransferase class I/II-fold pyridoxal phosphate-dependent enzyme [Bacteroidota bacterium]
MKFETKAIRIQTARTAEREHSTPLFPTSSFVFDDAEQMRSLFAGEAEGNIYSRFTNPNCRELEEKIAALEGVDRAVATASGMSAVFASMMTFLKAGDHVLASRAVFGSTYSIFSKYLPEWGIEVSWLPPRAPERWAAALRPNSKLLFVETPSNPGLDIVDLERAGQFCREHGLLYCVDNCFATPYLQRPARFGADLIIHSATKFIDGQGRVMGGLIAGDAERMEKVHGFCRSTGPALSPFNAWLLSKSLETLAVRLDRHCDNALALAQRLAEHPEVVAVHYPFLDSHPGAAIARRQMLKGGGLLTFEVRGGLEQGRKLLDALEWLSLSANLGDTRTIVTHPASTTHAKLPVEERAAVGITPGLLRVSVGLEHLEDIAADLEQALERSV